MFITRGKLDTVSMNWLKEKKENRSTPTEKNNNSYVRGIWKHFRGGMRHHIEGIKNRRRRNDMMTPIN